MDLVVVVVVVVVLMNSYCVAIRMWYSYSGRN